MAAPLSLEDTPISSPGACRRCGTSHGRAWYMNMGYVEDFHGTVYYCDTCVQEVAALGGYVKADEYLETKRHYDEMIKDQNDKFAHLVVIYDSLADIGIDMYSLVDFLKSRNNTAPASTREAVVEFRTSGFAESFGLERPNDVSNDDSRPATKSKSLGFSD